MWCEAGREEELERFSVGKSREGNGQAERIEVGNGRQGHRGVGKVRRIERSATGQSKEGWSKDG